MQRNIAVFLQSFINVLYYLLLHHLIIIKIKINQEDSESVDLRQG